VAQDHTKHEFIPGSVGSVRIFGVPVRLHFTFILLLVFLLFVGVGEKQSGASTAIYILALFASVLLHEVGHTLVARHYGIHTIEIVMFPIGGVSRPERQPKPGEELWISLAGPTVNLLIALILLGWMALQHGWATSYSGCSICCRLIPWMADGFSDQSWPCAGRSKRPPVSPPVPARCWPS
jgi:Zn-dependent protease